MGRNRILILGGTTEARKLAEALAGRAELDVLLSLAGRTATPLPHPVPVRSGGFGGADGLARFIVQEGIELLVDATHPFAPRISANAAEAVAKTGIAGFALRRPAWESVPGDRRTSVADMQEAVKALGASPRRVFLAIGRQEAHYFNAAPHHDYLVRSVDPVDPPLQLQRVSYVLSMGPFHLEDEKRLLIDHGIEVVVAKNSGGDATYAKIEAARELGIEVVMIRRALPANMPTVDSVAAALRHIDQVAFPAAKRGV